MYSKPVFVFVFPDCIGGVASFNRNLVNYTSYKEKCHVRVILLQSIDGKRDLFNDPIEADEVIRFMYSAYENQYSVCKRLNGLLGKEEGCIVTDNALVLNTVGLFGTHKRVVYLVHDYFYIQWGLQYAKLIDAAVTHSSFFRDVLLAASVKAYQSKAFYIPYGVESPAPGWKKRPQGRLMKLVFLGRLVEEKGVLLLKEIDRHLQDRGVAVHWTIIGRGPLLDTLQAQWNGTDYVQFIQASNTQEVYASLEEQDILVFPSQFEGTPVSIMESLSRGVVPVVSSLPGGTRDMVTEDTGILCNTFDAVAYADAICYFNENPGALLEKQQICIQKGRDTYDIRKASDAYFSFLFEQIKLPVSTAASGLSYYSRMDKKIWPNRVVYYLRIIRRKLSTN